MIAALPALIVALSVIGLILLAVLVACWVLDARDAKAQLRELRRREYVAQLEAYTRRDELAARRQLVKRGA